MDDIAKCALVCISRQLPVAKIARQVTRTQFCKTHTGLPENQTPAEAAKIDLKLNPENKLEDLIVKSAENKAISEGKFAVHLGFRVQYVEITNEKDSIKVKPKGWLDKQTWKEINDILRVHQFAWLSNGRDSCWIKMS
jgi:hypothetical protein